MALLQLLLLALPLAKPQVAFPNPLPHLHLPSSPNPKNGPFCEQFVEECLDGSSFPNIGQAFRGYNIILGDPLNYGGDPGFKGHIFDEAGERNGKVRFGNIAGNDLNRCDGSVRADFIETSEEFRESTTRSKSSGTNFKVGSEVELSGEVSRDVSAEVKVTENVGVGASAGAKVGASVTIPPLSQSSNSNSRVMTQVLESIETKSRSIIRAGLSCYEHEFAITEYQHPSFTSQFLFAVGELQFCLLADSSSLPTLFPFPFPGEQPQNSIIIPGKTAAQDKCAMKFLRNYGTHYIKAARFGSKMSILTIVDSIIASTANKDEIEKCATDSEKWSALGIVGGGSNTAGCLKKLSESTSKSTKVVEEEIVVTVGSRPKGDYREWADQNGKPEIVHKTISPISDLFTTDFMRDISFKENGDATMKELLETYIFNYCGLFRSECNYVVAKPYCPKDYCTDSYTGNLTCGTYTGPVDQNFLPHGLGTLRLGGGEEVTGIWVQGCAPDCDIYPLYLWQQSLVFRPGSYTLASQEQVENEKDWLLERLEKWAVAKFENGYIYGRGHGGQIDTDGKEKDVNNKYVVVCRNEVKTTDDDKSQTRTGKAMKFVQENIVQHPVRQVVTVP